MLNPVVIAGALLSHNNTRFKLIIIPWRTGPHKNKVFVGDSDHGNQVIIKNSSYLNLGPAVKPRGDRYIRLLALRPLGVIRLRENRFNLGPAVKPRGNR